MPRWRMISAASWTPTSWVTVMIGLVMTASTPRVSMGRRSAARRATSRSVMTPSGFAPSATTRQLTLLSAMSREASRTEVPGGTVCTPRCMIWAMVRALTKYS